MHRDSIRVGILSVGTELTEGIIQDAHVRYLGSLLKSCGFSVEKVIIIPDSIQQFRESLVELCGAADYVFVTGGLGPTSDDLSRDVIAGAAGVPLGFQPALWDSIQSRFRNAVKAQSNMRQACIPEGFTVIPNPVGTAPGFYGPVDRALVVALPGPPHELRAMFEQTVFPMIESRADGCVSGELRGASYLIPESRLEDLLCRVRIGDIHWGTRIEEGRIGFILKGGTEEDRKRMFATMQAEVGEGLIREGDTGADEQVYSLLKARGLTLVTAESCTGGLVGSIFTRIAGVSEVFWGGFISYHNGAKQSMLGVRAATLEEYGAVSEETVREMAEGALRVSGADVAVAVSGVAGPGGGTPEKPAGTVWIAAHKRGKRALTRKFFFHGTRNVVRSRAAVSAFLLVESAVLEKESLDSVVNSAYI